MNYQNSVREDEIVVFADSTIFSKAAILKCLYWYGDKFHTIVTRADEYTYLLSLKPLSDTKLNKEDLSYYLHKLEKELIDFQLRDIIINETGNVRDLLVAKAFSNGEFDEAPPGQVSDPVGFDPDLTPLQ